MKFRTLLSVEPWSWKFWFVSAVTIILLSSSLTSILVIYNLVFDSLKPCGLLDSYLNRSNCMRVLRYSYNVSHILDLSFSPDGQSVAASGMGDIPKVWRVTNGELLNELNSQASGVSENFQFSPNNQTIAFVQNYISSTLTLVDLESGAILFQLEDLPHISDIIYSPDGTMLAVAIANNNTIEFRQVPDGLLMNSFAIGDVVIEDMVFSLNGEKLLAVARNESNKTLYSWQVDNGVQIGKLPLNVRRNTGVAFSPDRVILAMGNCVQMGGIGCADAEVILWQISDGRLLRKLDVSGGYVNDLAFSADGTVLATSSYNVDAQGFIQLWHVKDGTLLDTLEKFTERHNQIAFSPNGEILAIGTEDVILWKIK